MMNTGANSLETNQLPNPQTDRLQTETNSPAAERFSSSERVPQHWVSRRGQADAAN